MHLSRVKTKNPAAKRFTICFSIDNSILNCKIWKTQITLVICFWFFTSNDKKSGCWIVCNYHHLALVIYKYLQGRKWLSKTGGQVVMRRLLFCQKVGRGQLPPLPLQLRPWSGLLETKRIEASAVQYRIQMIVQSCFVFQK